MKNIILSMSLLLLVACAYSPQQITISPKVDTSVESFGNGRVVTVAAEDGRANKALGTRGGIYKETSVITIANDIALAVARAAEARLAVEGFNVHSDDADVAHLKIIIDKLTYDTPDQSVGKKVLLSASLKVVGTAGGETFTGQYTSNSERQTVITPSMARNEEMINTLLSDTLARMFADPKLKAFLSNI
ncbi:MAG: YajG family lipoprotein [Spongiibacteraceae bacterium]